MNTLDSGGYPALVSRGDRTTAERAVPELDAPRAARPRTSGRVRLAVLAPIAGIEPQAVDPPVSAFALAVFQAALLIMCVLSVILA